MNALDTLNLNDSLGTCGKILNELFISLLQCNQISENDSTYFSRISPKNAHDDLPTEDFDSCFARQRKNFQEIVKSIHPMENYHNYNAYWDQRNDRIYQLNNQGHGYRQRIKLSITVYRQDCLFRPIIL